MFQWWKNPKTGEPYYPMYGRVAKGAPQLKQRKIESYEAGIEKGLVPASKNPAELIANSAVALSRAAASRTMLKALMSTESDIDGALLRSARSTEAKPLRIIESWKKLKDQNLTDGYVRFHHFALDKPLVFRSKTGATFMVKGDIGVQKELFPYVKAYIENPTYGAFSKLNFATKSLKLMSGFHVLSLSWQSIAGSPGMSKIPIYNVLRGLSQIKDGGETLKMLYRNGLELRGYADVGQKYGSIFEQMEQSKILRIPAKILQATQKFTFDVVHPGIKVNTAFNVFDNLVSNKESRLERPLNESEKDEIAKHTVNYVNRLFSGEDYRTALLQTNQWMAKYFYSPDYRKYWQAALISPQWQKAHIGMVQDIAGSIFTKKGRAKPTASLYRQYFMNALAIYGVANLYNYIETKNMDGKGKLMFQNEGNAFGVRAPYNDPDGRKVYFRPLKSIFEVPELLADPIGKTLSKLAPWITTVARQINPLNRNKYKGWAGVPARIKDVAKDLLAPMAVSTITDKSKATPSKYLSIIGLPTAKSPKPKRATISHHARI